MATTTIKNAYREYQSNRLMEARMKLLERGIYPFDVFLKEHSTEAITAAGKIEQLEEVASTFRAQVPTLHVFVQQNSSILLEGGRSNKAESVKFVMVNYAFICEAVGKCIKEAVQIFAEKHPNNQSLYAIYKTGASQLLEFCIKKSQAYRLMEGDASPIIKSLSEELTRLSITDLKRLCESVPSMRLYVPNKLHAELTQTILEG